MIIHAGILAVPGRKCCEQNHCNYSLLAELRHIVEYGNQQVSY
jgi:hypothetical protein